MARAGVGSVTILRATAAAATAVLATAAPTLAQDRDSTWVDWLGCYTIAIDSASFPLDSLPLPDGMVLRADTVAIVRPSPFGSPGRYTYAPRAVQGRVSVRRRAAVGTRSGSIEGLDRWWLGGPVMLVTGQTLAASGLIVRRTQDREIHVVFLPAAGRNEVEARGRAARVDCSPEPRPH